MERRRHESEQMLLAAHHDERPEPLLRGERKPLSLGFRREDALEGLREEFVRGLHIRRQPASRQPVHRRRNGSNGPSHETIHTVHTSFAFANAGQYALELLSLIFACIGQFDEQEGKKVAPDFHRSQQ